MSIIEIHKVIYAEAQFFYKRTSNINIKKKKKLDSAHLKPNNYEKSKRVVQKKIALKSKVIIFNKLVVTKNANGTCASFLIIRPTILKSSG